MESLGKTPSPLLARVVSSHLITENREPKTENYPVDIFRVIRYNNGMDILGCYYTSSYYKKGRGF